MRKSAIVFVAALPLFFGAPALSAPDTSHQRPQADPNERICEEVVQTGSRLGARRFCATRAEWDEKKRQDREAVEKAQLSPCVIATTGATGKPSC